MPAGRPPKGVSHVDALEGPEQLKQRLKVILQTITGETTVAAACCELDVGETQFHNLRRQALEGALSSLEARLPGRPRSPQADPERVALQERVVELEGELRVSMARTEVALTMPHLLKDRPAEPLKKTNSRSRRWRKGKKKRKTP